VLLQCLDVIASFIQWISVCICGPVGSCVGLSVCDDVCHNGGPALFCSFLMKRRHEVTMRGM
jgi:hypothetical protein